MSTTRVPQKTELFNGYIVTSDNFLQAISSGTTHNWERLELSEANADGWHSRRQEWDNLYSSFINPATHTAIVTEQVNNFKKEFAEYTTNILDKIAASDNATDEDAGIFNVVLSGNHKKPTHPTTPITELCFTTIEPLGGAALKLTFRTNTDTGRPSILPEADSVEIALQKGGTPPENVDDLGERAILTHATHVLQINPDKAGQKLYLACRWYHTKYPQLAGPWSNVITAVIA